MMIYALEVLVVVALLVAIVRCLRERPKCTLWEFIDIKYGERDLRVEVGFVEGAQLDEDSIYVLEVKDAGTGEDITQDIVIPPMLLMRALDDLASDIKSKPDATPEQYRLLSVIDFDRGYHVN